ncbi:SUPPRESSOR OF GAMMA RESPONSE 1-like isoform X3 [Olea europaea var. sylvestris]|uniref:SUPPRESSOR OF GAMMA RESPONSE 1-like isoform X3 n=1 Tax=Olea europaea var. sylvestris TaxID=158386 RepID=UPI000C1D0935|nr:SUPPRESSOR OF GAMMA RESPONSE 1-like isoform X3 [Olea europaea var. sylvestris]
MARSWLIDSRGLARKVKNATLPAACQIKECEVNRECPNCHHRIDNSDVSQDWPGLPAGVKFDPTDEELIEHLAAKCGVGNSKPHMFIDEFIPTLEGEEGICYTHPENLPGAKKDGSSVHFFYRTINAYASGRRKRRRIHGQESVEKGHVRWHKTGKTKPLMQNGNQKGCKKIMVLYETTKKGSKPNKCNWVMHQFHLGTDEDEREGEYVVSKISYQPQKETDKNETNLNPEESDIGTTHGSPKTPKTNTPFRPKPVKTPDAVSDKGIIPSPLQQEVETFKKSSHPLSYPQLKEQIDFTATLAGEYQAVDMDDLLLCNEIIDSYAPLSDLRPINSSNTQVARNITNLTQGDGNSTFGIADLENLELDTPPDFQLEDLQFASQDSIFDWLDRI